MRSPSPKPVLLLDYSSTTANSTVHSDCSLTCTNFYIYLITVTARLLFIDIVHYMFALHIVYFAMYAISLLDNFMEKHRLLKLQLNCNLAQFDTTTLRQNLPTFTDYYQFKELRRTLNTWYVEGQNLSANYLFSPYNQPPTNQGLLTYLLNRIHILQQSILPTCKAIIVAKAFRTVVLTHKTLSDGHIHRSRSSVFLCSECTNNNNFQIASPTNTQPKQTSTPTQPNTCTPPSNHTREEETSTDFTGLTDAETSTDTTDVEDESTQTFISLKPNIMVISILYVIDNHLRYLQHLNFLPNYTHIAKRDGELAEKSRHQYFQPWPPANPEYD
jgi:hypothetical protein